MGIRGHIRTLWTLLATDDSETRKWLDRRQGWLLVRLPLLVITVTLAVLALWMIPQWQVSELSNVPDKELFLLKDAARRTIAQIIAGGLILIGAYFAWRRVAAMEEGTEVERQGQITDRYIRAVEQLGSDKLQVRIGATYALERIAKNSPIDHVQIMEVLIAYLQDLTKPMTREEIDAVLARTGTYLRPETMPSSDAQAALNVILRRNIEFDLDRLVLDGSNLQGAKLISQRLKGIDFVSCNLTDARMRGADLAGAHFYGSMLKNTDLTGAHLSQAIFVRCDLDDAQLHGADLKGVDMSTVRGLTADQIRVAKTDDDTRLPKYLREARKTTSEC